MNEPPSGWISLAFSSAGVVASVLAPILFWAGFNRPVARTCTYIATGASSCTLAESPPGTHTFVYIGLAGIIVALVLSVTGWRIGRRHTESAGISGHHVSFIPDGQSLGKLGLLLVLVSVVFAAGLFVFAAAALSHPMISGFKPFSLATQ